MVPYIIITHNNRINITLAFVNHHQLWRQMFSTVYRNTHIYMHICVILAQLFRRSMSDMFEVASILSRRNDKNGNHQYLVEWKGYPKEDATWEPLNSLDSIKALIKTFDDKLDNQNKQQKPISLHHSKRTFLKEKIEEKNKAKKQSKPIIKVESAYKLDTIVQNFVSQSQYNVNDQKNVKIKKGNPKMKSQQASVSATSKSESSVIFSKKLMERLKNMQKIPEDEQSKPSKKIIDVQKQGNQESVEVLKMVYKQGYNKKVFELRIGDRITQLDLTHVKLMYSKALCEFYQKIFRIEV